MIGYDYDKSNEGNKSISKTRAEDAVRLDSRIC